MPTRPQFIAVSVPADQMSGHCEPLQIFRLERRLLVRSRQLGICIPPSVPAEGLATSIERFGAPHAFVLQWVSRVNPWLQTLPEV
jgi:hypothetical protein